MAMEEVMNDHSLTYQVQIRELYTLGMFLAKKKYLFLRLAYITFIIGAFASALIGLFSGVLCVVICFVHICCNNICNN